MGWPLIDAMRGMRDWMSLLAAIGNLSLAVIAIIGGRRSPLARPVGALCFVLFGWNFSTLVHHHLLRASQGPGPDPYEVLDAVFTALSPPLVLEVVLRFAGELRRHRAPRMLAWALFGGLAVTSLGALVSPAVAAWTDSSSWFVVFLAGYVPAFAFEVFVLGRYLRRTTDPLEQSRARLVLLALAIGGTFSMSDLVRGAGLPVPYLGAIGTFVAAALLTTLVVRFGLLERAVSARTTLYVVGMIVAFVVAYLVVLSAFAGRLPVQVFAACLLTLLALAVARELARSVAEARARTQRLAVLGRFSAQMAHDIKGPLTALLGAVQVLDATGDDEASRKEFLGLVTEQARRIGAIVDRYDRMARVEPRKTLVRIDDVVRAVARAHGVSDARIDLAAGAIEVEADRALLESALENVVRNAVEACEGDDTSSVRLETALETTSGGRNVAVVRVIDRGSGMDARVLELALDDFFTTKADGSGLGLAFVRRVLEAHGGTVTLASQPAPHRDRGTKVELRIPV